MSSSLFAFHQNGICAQQEQAVLEFKDPLLLNPDPIGKGADLNIVLDPALPNFVPATIGYNGSGRSRFLFKAATQQVTA